MFPQDREQLRRFYQNVWHKQEQGHALQGVELIIAQVLAQHPEYHELIQGPEAIERDFSVESGQTNPFLHMGMHIALAEQLQADRPGGIRQLHQAMAERRGDVHEAEHQMMECLGLVMWEAQRNNTVPDEQAYLECIRKLASK